MNGSQGSIINGLKGSVTEANPLFLLKEDLEFNIMIIVKKEMFAESEQLIIIYTKAIIYLYDKAHHRGSIMPYYAVMISPYSQIFFLLETENTG